MRADLDERKQFSAVLKVEKIRLVKDGTKVEGWHAAQREVHSSTHLQRVYRFTRTKYGRAILLNIPF